MDCDVGSWGSWSSCQAPPGSCGTREKLADAQNHGEKCAKARIIELSEFLPCNVACQIPVDCKVGPWGSWSSCSTTCGGGTKERTRGKIAEAVNNGTKFVSSRMIPLSESNTCNEVDCPAADHTVMLVRKNVGNPSDYFSKNFADYKAGFESKGESWLGLEKLHQLTSKSAYSLRITMTDFDSKTYVAENEQFQVGPGDAYTLSVSGFNKAKSTLGDSMISDNGGWILKRMKFTTMNKDQDKHSSNCAASYKGGWWYNRCMAANPTGLSTTSKKNGWQYVVYYHGGERGDKLKDSWAGAEYVLIPK